MKELFIQAHEELIEGTQLMCQECAHTIADDAPVCDRCGHWSFDCREIETPVAHFYHSYESETVCLDCLSDGPRPHSRKCGCDDCEEWDSLQRRAM